MRRVDAETLELSPTFARRISAEPRPGAIVVFGAGRPAHQILPSISEGTEGTEGPKVAIRRDTLASIELSDPLVSRHHAECTWDAGGWRVVDRESRNGTSVDGQPVRSEVRTGPSAIVRVGDIIVWLVPDVRPYVEHPVRVDGGVFLGATFGGMLQQIERAAEGRVLHLTGPSGAGKEVASRAFHEKSAVAKKPFVAINCAAIPEGVAERILFGAKKGSFSGAHADATGHLQEADGGTLFLDEVAELDLQVQGKLLRAIEAREIIPLGASRPIPVDVRFCSATHRDLRNAVAQKTFREDLYFRIGRPVIEVPSLAQRREEIAFLVDREVRTVGLVSDASLIEACLLRPWPGNVRELIVEVAAAARAAAAAGDPRVTARDLAPNAGQPLGIARETPSAPATLSRAKPAAPKKSLPDDDAIVAALREHDGKVASAARALGIHRNQLRRWITAKGVDPTEYRDE